MTAFVTILAGFAGFFISIVLTFLVMYFISTFDKDPTVSGAYFALACVLSCVTGPIGAILLAYIVYRNR